MSRSDPHWGRRAQLAPDGLPEMDFPEDYYEHDGYNTGPGPDPDYCEPSYCSSPPHQQYPDMNADDNCYFLPDYDPRGQQFDGHVQYPRPFEPDNQQQYFYPEELSRSYHHPIRQPIPDSRSIVPQQPRQCPLPRQGGLPPQRQVVPMETHPSRQQFPIVRSALQQTIPSFDHRIRDRVQVPRRALAPAESVNVVSENKDLHVDPSHQQFKGADHVVTPDNGHETSRGNIDTAPDDKSTAKQNVIPIPLNTIETRFSSSTRMAFLSTAVAAPASRSGSGEGETLIDCVVDPLASCSFISEKVAKRLELPVLGFSSIRCGKSSPRNYLTVSVTLDDSSTHPVHVIPSFGSLFIESLNKDEIDSISAAGWRWHRKPITHSLLEPDLLLGLDIINKLLDKSRKSFLLPTCRNAAYSSLGPLVFRGSYEVLPEDSATGNVSVTGPDSGPDPDPDTNPDSNPDVPGSVLTALSGIESEAPELPSVRDSTTELCTRVECCCRITPRAANPYIPWIDVDRFKYFIDAKYAAFKALQSQRTSSRPCDSRVNKFVFKLSRSSRPTTADLETATLFLVFEHQQRFAEELSRARLQAKLKSVDEYGITRYWSRQCGPILQSDRKAVIQVDTRLAHLIITDIHCLLVHGGPRVTLDKFHENYTFFRGKSSQEVRKILNDCECGCMKNNRYVKPRFSKGRVLKPLPTTQNPREVPKSACGAKHVGPHTQ